MRLVVTGGAGFIGSNFVRFMLARHDDVEILNLDKLTYAGNLENLRDVEDDPRYTFVKGDICDAAVVGETLRGADAVVNFAAETHVDRSISGPQDFIRTDVLGTHTLLEAVRTLEVPRFLQIGTDEVYGSTESGAFTEDSDLDPSSPYSASKAGADLLVLAYHRTFGTPVLITRSSNNYGAWQYPEKIVPLFITNAIDELAAAGLRRRPQRARLAVRGRQLRRHRPRAARGRPGAGLQHRRRQRGPEPGADAPHHRAARQGRRPHPLRHRPSRPRPALRHRLLEASRPWLAPRGRLRVGTRAHRATGTAPTPSGGGRSSRASGTTTTRASTARSAEARRRVPASAQGTFQTGVPTCTRAYSHRMFVLDSRVQPCE